MTLFRPKHSLMNYYLKAILRKGILTILVLSCSVYLFGQRFDFELGYLSGKIFKHRSGLLYKTPSYSQAFELNLIRYNAEDQGWQKFWNQPRFEGSLVHVIFGDNQVLGSATSIIPSMALSLKRWERSAIMFHFGFGIAYLNKKYDINDNPTNNAIGSHLNNATRFKMRYEYELNDDASLSLALNFMHFSNGLSSSPNSGINLAGAQIGYAKRIAKAKKTNSNSTAIVLDTVSYRRWGGEVQATYGVSENKNVPGGPKYSVYAYSAGVFWRYKRYLRLIVGLDYEYNDKIFNFFISGFAPEDEARDLATKTALYIANESFFSKFSFRNQIGIYLPYPLSGQSELLYYKTNINYYPIGSSRKFAPYLGAQLKTHYFKADYLAFLAGIKF